MDKMVKTEFLNIIPFSKLSMWDVKRHLIDEIQSNFPLIPLFELIKENNNKFKLNDFPEKEFGILGVNNVDGLFDAYTEKGSKINQSYKKMEVNELAYNPYRINVGSIGMKTLLHKNDFISPAYVVFSCNEKLSPGFLYKVFKTRTFDKIINENTTGSVRQNLKFETLKNIRIPLPSISEQKRFLKSYNDKIKAADDLTQKVTELQNGIESFLSNKLGVEMGKRKNKNFGLQIISFKEINRWALSYLFKKQRFSMDNVKFPIVPLKTVVTFFEGGKTPSTSRKDFWGGNIYWTSAKDMKSLFLDSAQDKITETALKEAKLKVYPKGTILGVFRSGILRHSFPVTLTQIETAINQDLKAIGVNEDVVLKEYFLFYLKTFQKLILERAQKFGVTVESINTDEFLEIPVVLPPVPIQKTIVNSIREMLNEINELLSKSASLKDSAIKEFENEIFQR